MDEHFITKAVFSLMKSLLLLIFLSVSSTAMGTPIDSSRCPLKNPFVLKFTVSGIFTETNTNSYSSYFDEVDSIDNRDTAHFSFFMAHDTLRYQALDAGFGPGMPLTVSIVFDTAKGVVPYLSHTKYSVYSNGLDVTYNRRTIILRNLLFDSSSIYSNDLTLENHLVSVVYEDGEDDNSPGNHHQYSRDLKTAYALDLSVGTRSSHFVSEASVPINDSPDFRIYSSAHSLRFEFKDLGESNVEVFNMLGSLVSRCEIMPDQTSFVVEHLPSGLLFVRFGNKVRKVYVAD